jgi:3-hydroxyisobutyrate dehydrogenase-like beta-hydroxyacid dehydrogenase
MASTTIAVLGLGEAGSALAADLAAAGASVRGWDPAGIEVDGVETAASDREAVRGADLVMSVNAASVAEEVAASVAAALSGEPRAVAGADPEPAASRGAGERPVFADLNTASPAAKRAVAEILASSPAVFADVALLGPVPGRGLRTPALVSGPGAERFAALVEPLGMPITSVGPEPGAAAARKLVRSVFAKGLAASVGEALEAADRLDCAAWLHDDIERTLTDADGALLRRLIEGSRRHAPRRAEEMAAATAMLEELGVEPRVAAASEAWLRSLSTTKVAP